MQQSRSCLEAYKKFQMGNLEESLVIYQKSTCNAQDISVETMIPTGTRIKHNTSVLEYLTGKLDTNQLKKVLNTQQKICKASGICSSIFDYNEAVIHYHTGNYEESVAILLPLVQLEVGLYIKSVLLLFEASLRCQNADLAKDCIQRYESYSYEQKKSRDAILIMMRYKLQFLIGSKTSPLILEIHSDTMSIEMILVALSINAFNSISDKRICADYLSLFREKCNQLLDPCRTYYLMLFNTYMFRINQLWGFITVSTIFEGKMLKCAQIYSEKGSKGIKINE
jgi:hypothetical protein